MITISRGKTFSSKQLIQIKYEIAESFNRCSRNNTHKEGEKSHNDEPTEKKTDVSSSKTDKSNNKTDSNSTTDSRKELKMTFDLLTKHIQECVRKELKKNRKRKPKNISHPQVNQVTVIHLVLIAMTVTATIQILN